MDSGPSCDKTCTRVGVRSAKKAAAPGELPHLRGRRLVLDCASGPPPGGWLHPSSRPRRRRVAPDWTIGRVGRRDAYSRRSYFTAVWQALVAALPIVAAVQTLLPRRWLVGALSGRFTTVAGGLCSLPSMMCSCCTAPVTTSPVPAGAIDTHPAGAEIPRSAPVRYLRALARLAIVLVPEYLVVVFAVGALRGWLFPLDGGLLDVGVVGAIVAAFAGTLVVIPTGGEIPILTGLAAAGAGAGVVGALVIVLPAIVFRRWSCPGGARLC
jgi:uncharacterized membrane protein YraQ (UPF0718 family)